MKQHYYNNKKIFTIKGFLSLQECEETIQRTENIGFTPATISYPTGAVLDTSIRNNERVNTIDSDLAHRLWRRLEHMVESYAGHTPHSLNPKINYYKYWPGQEFKFHPDGTVRYDEMRSFFTLLVYLNEDMEGGETVFKDYDLSIKPETGMLLCFRHNLHHKGSLVTEGLKYVLRSDIMFQKKSKKLGKKC